MKVATKCTKYVAPPQRYFNTKLRTLEDEAVCSTSTSLQTTSAIDHHSYQAAQLFIARMEAMGVFMEEDFIGCDAKWMLFVAAAMSYRYETLIRPFPEQFWSEIDGLQLDALIMVISEMPKLQIVLNHILRCNYEEFRPKSMDLLHWLLVTNHDTSLRTLNQCEYSSFWWYLSVKPPKETPTHVFEVLHDTETSQERRFKRLAQFYPVQIAYYGGRLDEYYALICAGCTPHDEPLTLSTNLADAIDSNPLCAGWGGSVCGSLIKCIAVCDVLVEPETFPIRNSAGGDCSEMLEKNPKQLETNGWNMRVTHLILFGSRIFNKETKVEKVMSLLDESKYFISMGLYLLLVSTLGMKSSKKIGVLRDLMMSKAYWLLEALLNSFLKD